MSACFTLFMIVERYLRPKCRPQTEKCIYSFCYGVFKCELFPFVIHCLSVGSLLGVSCCKTVLSCTPLISIECWFACFYVPLLVAKKSPPCGIIKISSLELFWKTHWSNLIHRSVLINTFILLLFLISVVALAAEGMLKLLRKSHTQLCIPSPKVFNDSWLVLTKTVTNFFYHLLACFFFLICLRKL